MRLYVTVSSQIKARVHALAERQLISAAVWLRRLVDAALREAAVEETAATGAVLATPATHAVKHDRESCRRITTSIRWRPEDWRLLQDRAQARSMRATTYASVLVRAHLHRLTPLPKDELIALKQSVAELGAIGRKLNQIAPAVSDSDPVAGLAREDLWALLKVCKAVRAEVKELIKANVSSWEVGDVEAEDDRT
jgi:hypothetical protein